MGEIEEGREEGKRGGERSEGEVEKDRHILVVKVIGGTEGRREEETWER